MAGWASPEFAKSEVNWAGRILVGQTPSDEDDVEKAYQIINNWRSSHGFPLLALRITLGNRASQVDASSLIAQRIKRLSSISYKLQRFPTMNMIQMQDVGGCRAVVSNVAQVRALRGLYRRMKHRLVREDDYITQPKASGYRSSHLVYRYMSDKKETYNGLQIEIQLRSRLQHAWATAVETVGTFLQQSLKASQGTTDWLRFFSLMGSALALRERTPLVPETPGNKTRLVAELRHHVQLLDVRRRLESYRSTLETRARPEARRARYYLLELNPSEGRLVVRGYKGNELDRATTEYLAVERALSGAGAEAVLVSVESLDQLRRAYPNYFLDTRVFLEAMRTAIS